MVQKKQLGQTGIDVSVLGLGAVKFGRNQCVKYPERFELPDDKTIVALLAAAKDAGINMIDVAPAYGIAEERIGQLLTSRHDWVLCSKAGEHFTNGESHFDFTPEGLTASVDNSLTQLRTDYLDVLLIHSDGNDMRHIEQDGVFETCAQLKAQGKIRSFGMSTKTVEGGLATVKHADVVMVTYNPMEQDQRPVIDAAAAANKGVFIKKALASGHAVDPIAALCVAVDMPGVSSVILGTLSLGHLQDAVSVCK
jgi:aryl-alcohol dehydrogenase-like predicted oxidoreductase